jgi:hypothetical protein
MVQIHLAIDSDADNGIPHRTCGIGFDQYPTDLAILYVHIVGPFDLGLRANPWLQGSGNCQSNEQREHCNALCVSLWIMPRMLDSYRKHQATWGREPAIRTSANSRGLLIGDGDARQGDLARFDLPIQVPIGRVDAIHPLDSFKKP